MRYETVFILTPVLSDVQAKEAVEKFSKVITDNGGSIVNVEEWGLRKLAYPIQKKNTGFYNLIEFEAPAESVKKLETAYRRDERVVRFLTFRLDKYAAEYAEKRRSLKKNAAKEEVKVEVEVKEN
ncbi:MAG: 30S ribosomal protein S6 [Muribaculaceae bacterium]|nr:30S ribosomal protein S6 [Muribaculaceae bacterium]